jgi:hypothetical protein
MPVLDAKALETDPEGCALLRSVLQSGRRRKPPMIPTTTAAEPDAQRPAKRRAKPPLKAAAMVLAEAAH